MFNLGKTQFTFLFTLTGIVFFTVSSSFAVDLGNQIIINGDTVEYSTENSEVTATGNVQIDYKGARLTCKKIKVNTQTKDGVAEGGVRLDDKKGVIEGEKIIYNFEKKSGVIIDSQFRANPYFGRARKVEKVSEDEFVARYGFVTTCNFDKPHYRIVAKKTDIFLNDKMQISSATFFLGQMPLVTVPQFNQSLTDHFMHLSVMPGHRKEWGYYLLDAWKYNLTDNINGRVYLDYRSKLGAAEGFNLNYNTLVAGRGDFKLYYTDEKPTVGVLTGEPSEYQRYMMRLRHKWDIDPQTNLVIEALKISDERMKFTTTTGLFGNNFLKDYFYREYEQDSQPLSYASFHHNFSASSFDVVTQYRLNHSYDQLDKLPEAKYTLPSMQIAQTPFYFENLTSVANFNKKATTAPVSIDDVTVSRFDTFNKLSLPSKVAFIRITPFVASRQTVYDKGSNDQSLPVRTVLYYGADMSTKFYRVFDVKSNFLGMDINGLRHIITPTVGYAYNHTPTVPVTNLYQIDSIDAITASDVATLGLENKLQTKRKGGAIVDILDFRVTSNYIIKPKTLDTGVKSGSNLSDILFNLELLPYSWIRLDADAIYNRSVSRLNSAYGTFTEVNYDLNFDFAPGRSFGIGQRYLRSGGNQITCGFNWYFNPKWSFSMYERFEMGHDPVVKNGFNEQEYTISRDLHCWTMDMSFNVSQTEGQSIWFVFKLKAFPGEQFGFHQKYHSVNSGAQSNP